MDNSSQVDPSTLVEVNSLSAKYKKVRSRTEGICSPLEVEDYIPQPTEFVSPMKWQLGHTTWFFEEMILKKFDSSYTEFDGEFGFLFNSYYNHVGERTVRANRGDITRPGVSEVYAYRAFVDNAMMALMESNLSSEIEELIVLGLNHEQQHQELMITDLKYTLALNPTSPAYSTEVNYLRQYNQSSGWVNIKEGVYAIGFEGSGFHYDNELGRHKVYLPSSQISRSLVTNSEFIEFIESGGYEQFEHWLDEGWSWVCENQIKHPLYWFKKEGEWWTYSLNGNQKVDPEAILCHISLYEAAAYASWRGLRLPTEFEWEVASDQFNWGERWEWTMSAYLPYPGFEIAKGAVGEYNGKFMMNQMVLRGASTATAANHSRKTYRNFFHPHFQWQFTGIRLAK